MVERTFIKEKIADLTVQLAKRAWPQLWPDMVPTLMQLANMGVCDRAAALWPSHHDALPLFPFTASSHLPVTLGLVFLISFHVGNATRTRAARAPWHPGGHEDVRLGPSRAAQARPSDGAEHIRGGPLQVLPSIAAEPVRGLAARVLIIDGLQSTHTPI